MALPICPQDDALLECQRRIRAIRQKPALPGTPEFDEHRIEILGRAKGEPVVFVQAPAPTPDEQLSEKLLKTRQFVGKLPKIAQVRATIGRHRRDPAALRALLLRQGYVFSADPQQALILVKALRLARLFSEPEIWLQRGKHLFRLERHGRLRPEYRHSEGIRAGTPAEILFADRVAVQREELDNPLHRDIRDLAHEIGFDRAKITYRTEESLIAELRFHHSWFEALLTAQGAELKLACLAAPALYRGRVAAWRQADLPRRRALRQLRTTVTRMVAERLRFDRPRGAEDHLSDGQLRPNWEWAYKTGRIAFSHKEKSYMVFDHQKRPWPPETCVEFVIDSLERASGNWFRPLGQKRERTPGRLNFTTLGIKNRAGVLAFGRFAADRPEHFEVRYLDTSERIPFGYRSKFFGSLLANVDKFAPGDIVSIQGIKRDGKVHQHAILLEETDPLTGFAYGLVDQMSRPRRRTWEGIMAEAPRRSLLYHIRLKPHLLHRLDPELTPPSDAN